MLTMKIMEKFVAWIFFSLSANSDFIQNIRISVAHIVKFEIRTLFGRD